MIRTRTRRLSVALLGTMVALGGALPAPGVHADDPLPPPPPAPAAPPTPAAPPVPAPGGLETPGAPPPTWTADQLRELVGPIALYPDVVLASLLPATNFPLDVVAAARWLAAQGGTKPTAVPEDQPWDASVKALLQFPDVLRWMDANLAWLEQMGTAVTYQQADVLQAIQDFRRAARAAGNLASDEHLTVAERTPTDAPATAPTVVVIEPTQPEVVYVPAYDPYVVVRPYDPRWYGPPLTYGIGFHVGLYGAWAWHDLRWGWWSGSAYLGWGIYMSDAYYYWGRPRPPGWYVGPYRPRPWLAPYRTTSWHYPPRTISRATPYGRVAGPVYRSGVDSYAVRPPLDPRPTTRSYVRTIRSPSGSTVVPPSGSSFVRTPTTRSLPTPSPTVRTTPWSGSTLPRTWTPRTPTQLRSTPSTTMPSGTSPPPLPTAPSSGSRVYTPQGASNVRPWSARGAGSLAPYGTRTLPTVQHGPTRTFSPSQPQVIRSAPLPAPIRGPSQLSPGFTRRSSDRGHSSLYQPPPPPRTSGRHR